MKCSGCDRGSEACGYCHDLAKSDVDAICDCGLVDFGCHLLDCRALADKHWVVATSKAEADMPR